LGSVVVSAGIGATAVELLDETERSGVAAACGRRVTDGETAGVRRVVWSVATSESAVALTFDDGPDPVFTPLVLDVLERAGVPATFLVVGRRIEARPDLLRAVVAAGHEVGSHTSTHADLGRASGAATVRELTAAASVIQAAVGRAAGWFRPPWGHLTGAAVRVAAELGHDVLLWSASAHGLGGSPDAVAEGLVARLAPGKVVLLHDGVRRGRSRPFSHRTADLRHRRELEIAALPQVIDRAHAAGWRFVTASELVALDVTPRRSEGPSGAETAELSAPTRPDAEASSLAGRERRRPQH
jgi:peptidoglycan/xylan/chitin deacetylase (PgdA/CDA1 family)